MKSTQKKSTVKKGTKPKSTASKHNKYIDLDDRIDVQSIINVNKHKLDKEWESQPNNVFLVGEKAAELRKIRDAIKDKLDFTESDILKKMRQNPDEYGLEKITEAALNSSINRQPEIVKLKKELNEAKYDHEIFENLKNVLEHKKRSLENLVHLYSTNYWSTPKDSTGGEAGRKQNNEDISSKINL